MGLSGTNSDFLQLSQLSCTIWDYLGLCQTLSDSDCLGNLELSQTVPDYQGLSGTIWHYLGLSGTIFGYLYLSSPIWDYLAISGTDWDYLGLYKTIWDYLVKSGTIWEHLELSRIVSDNLGISKTITDHRLSRTYFGLLENIFYYLGLDFNDNITFLYMWSWGVYKVVRRPVYEGAFSIYTIDWSVDVGFLDTRYTGLQMYDFF